MAETLDGASTKPISSPPPSTSQTPTFTSVNRSSSSNALLTAKPSTDGLRHNGVSSKSALPESQPMTATSSSSSHPPEQTNGATPETNGASPYGTRSRNRTGNSRPNYAEDRDPDMDFEFSANRKPHAMTFVDKERSSGTNTRRSSNAAIPTPPQATTKAASPSSSRDPLPGMSSFSLSGENGSEHAAPAPSRKRKAPGATPGTQPVATAPSISAAAPMRKATSSAAVLSSRASNLMSFALCRGYLKNGKLKADDGTILSVDGTLIIPPAIESYRTLPSISATTLCTDAAQTRSTSSANRRESHITLHVSWNSCMWTTTDPDLSTRCESIGTSGLATSSGGSMTPELSSLRCNPTLAL